MPIFQQKLRVGFVYIDESFDTIFNMGYGSGKSLMAARVKGIITYKAPTKSISVFVDTIFI